jgi:hypothetical protein
MICRTVVPATWTLSRPWVKLRSRAGIQTVTMSLIYAGQVAKPANTWQIGDLPTFFASASKIRKDCPSC